jgi:hypothetical protein
MLDGSFYLQLLERLLAAHAAIVSPSLGSVKWYGTAARMATRVGLTGAPRSWWGASLPDSYGKRQRNQVKAKKATAREERRVARAQRRANVAARDSGHQQSEEHTP